MDFCRKTSTLCIYILFEFWVSFFGESELEQSLLSPGINTAFIILRTKNLMNLVNFRNFISLVRYLRPESLGAFDWSKRFQFRKQTNTNWCTIGWDCSPGCDYKPYSLSSFWVTGTSHFLNILIRFCSIIGKKKENLRLVQYVFSIWFVVVANLHVVLMVFHMTMSLGDSSTSTT